MKALKARNVKAWANGPGKRPTQNCKALKARNNSESEETPMPQSLSSILIHLVFSAKNLDLHFALSAL